MELDEQGKRAVRDLGATVNRAIEKSVAVAEAIEFLRELGYEPHLTLKLEIALQEIGGGGEIFDDFAEDVELDLTDEDVQTLRRMKIRLDT